MMVGDDNVKSDGFGICDLIDGRNTGIHRDDKPGSMLLDGAERRTADTVSLTVSCRDIIIHVCSMLFQVHKENGNRSNTVYIIIAVYGNLLIFLNCPADSRDRRLDIL